MLKSASDPNTARASQHIQYRPHQIAQRAGKETENSGILAFWFASARISESVMGPEG